MKISVRSVRADIFLIFFVFVFCSLALLARQEYTRFFNLSITFLEKSFVLCFAQNKVYCFVHLAQAFYLYCISRVRVH